MTLADAYSDTRTHNAAEITSQKRIERMQLVCPAGSLPALMAAVDNGADDVYMGIRDETNARNFAGMNFDEKSMREGIRYAHSHGTRLLMALNTYPQPSTWQKWRRAVDLGVDHRQSRRLLQ